MKKFLKKSLITITILLSTVFATTLTTTQPTYADNTNPSNHSNSTNGPSNADNSGNSANCRYLLGMPSWDCDTITNPQNEEQLKTNALLIARNIFASLSVIATYLAVGFIIYGGYLYMFSSGDPTKAMIGKKTLSHAFIGLAITMLANIILNTIRIALLTNNGSFNSCSDILNGGCADMDTASTIINNIIDWVIGVSGTVAAIFVVVGGVGYMTSRGDPSKLQKAKTTILYALIGLVVVALSKLIFTFVFKIIDDNSGTSNTSTSIQYIAKT